MRGSRLKSAKGLLAAIALLLATPACIRANDTGRFTELRRYRRWGRVVQRASGEAGDFVVLSFKGKCFIVSRASDFADPTAIPPPANAGEIARWDPAHEKGISGWAVQGNRLLAINKNTAGFHFGWRDLRSRGQQWVFSPPLHNYRILHPVVDRQGRLFASHDSGTEVFYQSEPGGPNKAYAMPLFGPGHCRMHPVVDLSGGCWMFSADVDHTIDAGGGVKGALRFHDGKITHIDLHEPDDWVTAALPVTNDLLYVSFWKRKGLFIDTATGRQQNRGPFDPAAFGTAAVSHWGRAPDGTVWMTTFRPRDLEQAQTGKRGDRYGQIWRWNNQVLTMVLDGFNRDPHLTTYTDSVLAISASKVIIGCGQGEVFQWSDGKATWLDYRHGLAFNTITAIHRGMDFVLVSGHGFGRFFMSTATDLGAIPAGVSSDLHHETTLADIVLDRRGIAWTAVERDGKAVFAFWTGENWKPAAPMPVAPSKLWGVSFDSENRPWIYGDYNIRTVWIGSGAEWLVYKDQAMAYAAEEKKYNWQLDLGFIPRVDVKHRPLIVQPGELWFIGQTGVLNILRDGSWRTPASDFGGWREGPYVGPDGHGRILKYHMVLAYVETELRETAEKAPTQVNPPPQHYAWKEQCKQDPRTKGHGRIFEATRMDGGILWATTDEAKLLALGDGISAVYSLDGSMAAARPAKKIIATHDGTVFLDVGKPDRYRDWVRLSADIPRIEFKADITESDNEISIRIHQTSLPLEQLRPHVRLDGGEWQETLRIIPVVAGEHTVEVVCRRRKGLYRCTPIQHRIEVAGDLSTSILNLIGLLGAPQFQTRQRAEAKLREIGKLAVPHLRKAQTHADPEIRFRVQRILHELAPDTP
ncbi:MAG: hypothetical protein KAI66_07020 [Lentisphaeria bacterium]|nr:hypothetical protein [Lentisphaeria bacterium]